MTHKLPEYSAFREVNVLKEGEVVKDYVIAEEPLEIFIKADGEVERIATTMRTPGEDALLGLGYLKSEGLLIEVLDVSRPEGCEGRNQVVISMPSLPPDHLRGSQRVGVQSSSCGLCGKVSLESILGHQYPVVLPASRKWRKEDFTTLSLQIEEHQPLFSETGGSHSVWLFNEESALVASFEDVGRHNALDKLLGWTVTQPEVTYENMTLILSSRLSYELVHKAALLGVWVIASVGAPSSLAVELANKLELTTVGFLKKQHLNLYTNKRALFL